VSVPTENLFAITFAVFQLLVWPMASATESFLGVGSGSGSGYENLVTLRLTTFIPAATSASYLALSSAAFAFFSSLSAFFLAIANFLGIGMASKWLATELIVEPATFLKFEL